MTTFYSIHAYDQQSRYDAGEDRIKDGKLYTTFDKACTAIEKKIQDHINSEEENEVFRAPNREDMERKMGKYKYVHYYETDTLWLWVISKWEVEKTYVYQYWVENKICGLHTKSGKYASFDEACDDLDRELSELHEAIGKHWTPHMTREEFKEYMGEYTASTYDFFNDDKYVLSRQDA